MLLTLGAKSCANRARIEAICNIMMLAAAALIHNIWASFVLLDPEHFRDTGFTEGWPGPYANGTGAGEVNESSYLWAKSNLPFFETSDPDIQVATAAFLSGYG